MPDRAGEDRPGRDDPDALPDELWAAEQRRREAAAAAAAAQAALDACTLCDTHGLNPAGLPCHHIDGAAAAQRGMAALRALMGWDEQTPTDTHENPPTGQPDTKNDAQKTSSPTAKATHLPKPPTNPPAPKPRKLST